MIKPLSVWLFLHHFHWAPTSRGQDAKGFRAESSALVAEAPHLAMRGKLLSGAAGAAGKGENLGDKGYTHGEYMGNIW